MSSLQLVASDSISSPYPLPPRREPAGGIDARPRLPMISEFLDAALKETENEQLLINIVSQRVRQLNQGHRPMVETSPSMSPAEIALKEIAERKLLSEELGADGSTE